MSAITLVINTASGVIQPVKRLELRYCLNIALLSTRLYIYMHSILLKLLLLFICLFILFYLKFADISKEKAPVRVKDQPVRHFQLATLIPCLYVLV